MHGYYFGVTSDGTKKLDYDSENINYLYFVSRSRENNVSKVSSANSVTMTLIILKKDYEK